jgi:hypothetical protein
MIGGGQNSFTAADNTTHTIAAEGAFSYIRITGSPTLSTGSYQFTNNGASVEAGALVVVEYVANINYGGGYIAEIFGRPL